MFNAILVHICLVKSVLYINVGFRNIRLDSLVNDLATRSLTLLYRR